MKPRFSNQQNHALTLVEVLVVITVLAILAAIFLPAIAAYKVRKLKIRNGCVNNLREISLAYRVWEGDHGDKYPMFVSVTKGGAMELIATGNVAACFQVMSNELSTPIILTCPEDKKRLPAATNFFDIQLKDKISYFIGVDAKESQPQMFLSGDDNLAVDGIPPKSGLLELSTNSTIEWTTKRHDRIGNIGLADGSVGKERLRHYASCFGILVSQPIASRYRETVLHWPVRQRRDARRDVGQARHHRHAVVC